MEVERYSPVGATVAKGLKQRFLDSLKQFLILSLNGVQTCISNKVSGEAIFSRFLEPHALRSTILEPSLVALWGRRRSPETVLIFS